jgi:ubiquinone/menaquinone biosynthesis C-methylase UbiE
MKQREKVVPLCKGRVLEVGAGGGLNLAYYDRSEVETVFGLDNSPELLDSARDRAIGFGMDFRPMLLDAEKIALDDNSMDTVLVTYTLCSISNVASALDEMRRVLKPDGRLVFCEHGAAPDRRVLRLQHALTPIWRRLSGNCHLDRDTVGLIRSAGFNIGWQDEMYLPGTMRFAGFNRWGVATKR